MRLIPRLVFGAQTLLLKTGFYRFSLSSLSLSPQSADRLSSLSVIGAFSTVLWKGAMVRIQDHTLYPRTSKARMGIADLRHRFQKHCPRRCSKKGVSSHPTNCSTSYYFAPAHSSNGAVAKALFSPAQGSGPADQDAEAQARYPPASAPFPRAPTPHHTGSSATAPPRSRLSSVHPPPARGPRFRNPDSRLRRTREAQDRCCGCAGVPCQLGNWRRGLGCCRPRWRAAFRGCRSGSCRSGRSDRARAFQIPCHLG